jgi:hypothetical protein
VHFAVTTDVWCTVDIAAIAWYPSVAEVGMVESWAVQIPVWVVVPILLLIVVGVWKLVKLLVLAAKG